MLFKPYFTRLSQTIGTWLGCYCFSWSFFLFCRFMGCCCCFCGLGWSCGRHPVARGSRLQTKSTAKAQDLAPSPPAKPATFEPALSFCRPLSSQISFLLHPRSSRAEVDPRYGGLYASLGLLLAKWSVVR